MRLKRLILADVPAGGIVRTKDGRWGVVCSALNGTYRNGLRAVDFWHGGREHVAAIAVVEWQDR